MKRIQIVLAAATLLVFAAGSAMATTGTAPLTVSATVTSSAKISLDASAISFADADPETVSTIASSPASVTVTAKSKTTANSAATLTVLSATELTSGTDTIPVSKVTWTATGAGYIAGAMGLTAQDVGSWTGSGIRTGALNFKLTNGWYPVGAYSAETTFTLSNP